MCSNVLAQFYSPRDPNVVASVVFDIDMIVCRRP